MVGKKVMIEILGFISSLVTCVLFGLYVVGHIWDYENNKVFRQEKFENVYLDNIEETDNVIILDEIGTTFSISSAKGIRKISVYKVLFEIKESGELKLIEKILLKEHGVLYAGEKLYIKADLGEILPKIEIDVLREDYTNVTFDIYESGKNGNVISQSNKKVTAGNHRFKYGIRSFIYYLSK